MHILYFTADLHGDISTIHKIMKSSLYNSAEPNYLFICGDFCLPYHESRHENKLIKALNKICIKKNLKINVITGNHDFYPNIYKYPVDAGGYRRIRSNIIYLERGYIYDIGEYSIFSMGGAWSSDRLNPYEDRPFFDEEIPNKKEIEWGWESIRKAEKIDIILSHAAPISVLREYYKKVSYINPTRLTNDPVPFILEKYRKEIIRKFRDNEISWINGHYHQDVSLYMENIKHICLFNKIWCLENKNGGE